MYFSPAKINLFLHIVGRRPDGYHNLQTIFQFLDFGDHMSFLVNTSGKVQRKYDYGFSEQVDLNLRAAQLLKDYVGDASLGVDIDLTKHIPMGGGLGGGSSNAATTLKALNDLWDLQLPAQKLIELGASLGADVPVFVFSRSAWGEGVGEKLTPIELPTPWYVVLYPPVQVTTAEIFSHNHLTHRPQMKKIRALQNDQLLQVGFNDLEPVVRRLVKEVDHLINWMNCFGQARMSGSGSCVFMPCESKADARSVLDQKPTGVQGFIARGLNRIENNTM